MRPLRAAVAAALLLPAWSSAQEAPTARLVTEREFLEALATDSPALRALRDEAGLARADGLAARALENPRLAASREAPADATEQLDLTLSWVPPRPDRRRLAIEASDAAVTAAESRREVGELALRLAVREAFARWALADAEASRLASLADRLTGLARTQRRRADAGEVSGLVARRMEVAASTAGAELAAARGELATARAGALRWRPDLTGDLRPALPDLPPAPTVSGSHPSLAALEADLEEARLERDLAQRFVAMPEIVAGWQRQRADGGDVADGPIVGLEWPLPLIDRDRAGRARAEVRVDALEARLDLARRSLEAQRRGALAAYELLRTAALETAGATAGTRPMVEAASEAFRLGEATVTDLLDTLRAASEAELRALELRSAALEAHRELERFNGDQESVHASDP